MEDWDEEKLAEVVGKKHGAEKKLETAIVRLLKGLSSKPSGDCIVSPNPCFLSSKPQILAPATFFQAR